MGSLSTWGALATCLLALECFVFMFAVLAVVFGAKLGMTWLLDHVASWLQTANRYLLKAQAIGEKYQGIVAAPVVRARATWYGLRHGMKVWSKESKL